MSRKKNILARKFKEGIDILLNFIKVKDPSIYKSLINKNRSFNYRLQYRFFLKLTGRSWFKDNTKDVEIPISKINSDQEKEETFTVKKIIIIDEILKIFEELFPIPFIKILTISEHNLISMRRVTSENLFYQAFYEILHGYINEDLE